MELITGILALTIFIGVVGLNLLLVSRQISALHIDTIKIKNDIEEIKKATGDNAFEAMLDKPIPIKYKWSQ